MTTPTTWQATYARRHARVEIERPMRPPATASVLAIIDARIAAIDEYVAPDDERPITTTLRNLHRTTLHLQRSRVLRGWPTTDEIEHLAVELERRAR